MNNITLSVIGIGYVGAVASACLCESGHKVIAVDKDENKLACLEQGRSPFFENNLEPLIKDHVRSGRLTVRREIEAAILASDASMICVGTPSLPDGAINLEAIRSVCMQIGKALQKKDTMHHIIVRSTLLPGTTEELVIPLLEENSGKKEGIDFIVAYNPEFLREGEAIHDYFHPTQIIIGVRGEEHATLVKNLYAGVHGQRHTVSLAEAESIKYLSNCWRAHKISFANEMGRLLHARGVDPHKAMQVFVQDDKINMSAAFLRPGFAFGGSCLPKDVRAMHAMGKAHNIQTPVLSAMLAANDAQIEQAIKIICDYKPARVLMLGQSFKPGTDDMRESPHVFLRQKLEESGIKVSVYDIHIQEMSDEHILSSEYDLVVLGHAIPAYLNIARDHFAHSIPVVSLDRPKQDIEYQMTGLCW